MGEPIRMAELCAGYGGLFLAARAAGWPVDLAWYAEVDPDACAVLAAHHPAVKSIGDITTAQFSVQEPVDLLAAGFPCQGVSAAGKQLGSADERWLWPDVARAVRVLQPAVFVGENVPRLLSIEDGTLFGGILADLDGLGYTVRWTTVGACKVGLCHHRHRLFIAATREPVELDRHPLARRTDSGWEIAADTLFGAGLLPEWPDAGVVSSGLAWELPAEPCGITSGVTLLPTPMAGDWGTPGRRSGEGWRPNLSEALLPTPAARLAYKRGTPSVETAADRMASGRRNLEDAVALLPTPTARDGLSGPGHAITAEGSPDQRTVAALLPTPRARDGKGRDPNPRGVDLNEAIAQLLPTPRASDGIKGGPNQRGSSGDLMLPSAVLQLLPTPTTTDANGARNATASRRDPKPTSTTTSWTLSDVAYAGRWGRYEAAIRRHELVTGRAAPEPIEPNAKGGLRLAAPFVEWMQALPAGWVTDHIGRNPALARLGNGIAIPAGAYALSLLLPDGVRPQLAEVARG